MKRAGSLPCVPVNDKPPAITKILSNGFGPNQIRFPPCPECQLSEMAARPMFRREFSWADRPLPGKTRPIIQSSLKRSPPWLSNCRALPYAYDALAALHVEGNARVPSRQAPSGLRHQRQQAAQRPGLEDKSLEDVVKQSYSQECRPLQQCRPALQPHPFLEVDEEGRRRQEAAGGAAEGGRCRSRRLRQVPRRFHPGRRYAVRLRLGLDRGQERQARNHQDAERREPAGARRARRSSASMSGSTPITSTTATPARNTSRPSSTT